MIITELNNVLSVINKSVEADCDFLCLVDLNFTIYTITEHPNNLHTIVLLQNENYIFWLSYLCFCLLFLFQNCITLLCLWEAWFTIMYFIKKNTNQIKIEMHKLNSASYVNKY